MLDYKNDSRFEGIEPFEDKVWLASPTMHGLEQRYVQDAFDKNWITTAGENVNELEKIAAEYVGVNQAVGLSCGTAAIHLAVKLAAERIYNSATGTSTPEGRGYGGSLYGKRVFCTDVTFDATVNPIVYEGGEPIFIDSENDTWNMSPKALERAFEMYPDVRIVVMAHLYGVPGKIDEIKSICKEHNALLIEDAAESLGATYKGRQTGSCGDYGIISFNGNKIITGSSGGILLVDDEYSANKARKWSTQAREAAPWYEHEELGYNYRISNVVAGVARGNWEYLDEHISQKKAIFERYEKGFSDLPVKMNPFDKANSVPNYWLSCMTIDEDAMEPMSRSARESTFVSEHGKSCPTEILEALSAFNAEGRPIWKPMHMQPIYMNNAFVTASGSGRGVSNAYIASNASGAVGTDIFDRGLCLPSDNKMTAKAQDKVIEIVRRCFE